MRAKHLILVLALGCEEVDAGDGGNMDSGTGGESSDPSEGEGEGEGSETSGPSVDPQTVEDCRNTCDSLLSFGCFEADVHEACREVCGERSAEDIETFIACWLNTDGCGECYENFVDAGPPPDPTTGGSGTQGTCLDACEEFVGDGCTLDFDVEFTSCDEFCGMLPTELHELVIECVAERDGCTLPEWCTTSSGGG